MSYGALWSRRSDPGTTAERQRNKPSRSLTSRAVALLARRDHSRAELIRKLARHVGDKADPTELVRVLDELGRNGLLSDERFAAAVLRNRAQRFGDARIRHDLRRFGVADETSAAALATLAGSEVARAQQVWSKRFTALPTSATERAKQARFLQSRGFSLDSIFRALRGEVDDGHSV